MDFNPDQFRQPAFRGFGDQAMRRYRATPSAPDREPAPQRPTAPAGHQGSLFQAAEVQGTPPQPTFNADQFRRAQHALPGMSSSAMAGQRVTPPERPAEPAPQPAGSRWVQPELPTPPVPDNTPSPPSAAPSGPGRQVSVNALAYRDHSQRFGPAPQPPDPPAASGLRRPAAPNVPPAPPAPRTSRISSETAKAGRVAGVGAFVAAKALQSLSKPATDPKRSGNPLYESSNGWMRS